jgi:predicted DNA-binding antitoxin AbrB/MazE fold protein
VSLKAKLRALAAEKNGPSIIVPVLNDPQKVLSMPESFRAELLTAYCIKLEDLVGEAPFHMTFVREGIAFGILAKSEDGGIRKVLHGVDLRPGEDANILMVGSEVYDIWKSYSSQQLMTYEQLTKNYDKLQDALPQPN